MSRLAVARAAQLLGVSRRELQQRIQRLELGTFEGTVELSELRRLYPRLALDARESAADRSELIRQTAFGRQVRTTVVPERDCLEAQLHRREVDLSLAKARVEKYRNLLENLAQMLCAFQESEDLPQREVAQMISLWLLARLEE